MDIQGKVAIVTGGASGIGAGLAQPQPERTRAFAGATGARGIRQDRGTRRGRCGLIDLWLRHSADSATAFGLWRREAERLERVEANASPCQIHCSRADAQVSLP